MVVVWMHYESRLNHENGSKIWTLFPSCTRQDQFSLVLTFPAISISEVGIRIKINLNFYFYTSLRCLKRFKVFINFLEHCKEV